MFGSEFYIGFGMGMVISAGFVTFFYCDYSASPSCVYSRIETKDKRVPSKG